MSRRACGGAPFARRKIKSMANRYALRMDLPQSWAIVDVFTGQPAVIRQKVMVGMSPREAEDMVVQMNVGDIRRRERAERKG